MEIIKYLSSFSLTLRKSQVFAYSCLFDEDDYIICGRAINVHAITAAGIYILGSDVDVRNALS